MANQQRKFSTRVVIPRPDRMRRLGFSGFGWVDARILKDGWLAALSAEAVSVYLFLCLVANPQGISWYRRDRMREALNLHEGAVLQALNRLRDLDLVAFLTFGRYASEGFWQVLSVPPGGPSFSDDVRSAVASPQGI